MRPDVDHGEALERGEPHRGAHVVGELQERRAEDAEPAVRVHAVQDRAHPVLADAEVEVAARERVVRDRSRRPRSACSSTERGRPSRRRARARSPRARGCTRSSSRASPASSTPERSGSPRSQPSGSVPGEHALELGRELGMRRAVRVERARPSRRRSLGAARALVHRLVDTVGHEEVLVGIPAVGLLRQADLLLAERRAVRLRGVLRVRGARTRCACAGR